MSLMYSVDKYTIIFYIAEDFYKKIFSIIENNKHFLWFSLFRQFL